MLGFRDMTFCASKDCIGKCGRQWTSELQAQAENWWGSPEAPVAFSLFCGEESRYADLP